MKVGTCIFKIEIIEIDIYLLKTCAIQCFNVLLEQEQREVSRLFYHGFLHMIRLLAGLCVLRVLIRHVATTWATCAKDREA
jgi:hypothetical protein